ncbi:MAG TPA: hypothetical protein VKN99_17075 [Polyangia bacterium]|nr:hypothetical protein [Polyangia bacterium]
MKWARLGVLACALTSAGRAAAQQPPADYGPAPAAQPAPAAPVDDYGPAPSPTPTPAPAAHDDVQARPPAPALARLAPMLQIAWRRLAVGRVGEAMPGDSAAMNALVLDWYPYSSYLRLGLSTEYARESSARSQTDWYLAEHLTLGLQRPGLMTPFVEVSVGAGYFKRFVVGQEQPTAIWQLGASGGVLLHFAGPAFVSASLGWVRPVWLVVSPQLGASAPQDSLQQVYLDTVAFKLGLGF